MKRSVSSIILIAVVLLMANSLADAQVRWIVGGRLGISIFTGGPAAQVNNFFNFLPNVNTPSSTQVGMAIGPTAEVVFAKQYAICTSFDINTQAGTPIIWANTFKVYFPIAGSKILPYADGGFLLSFVTGGPWFGAIAGGGALFPISKDLYIPADLQFAPVFTTGAVTFGIVVTSGIRYII